MAADDDLGLKLFKRADKLRTKRSSIFDNQWQKISSYFWPDVSDINTEKTESTEDWFDRIYETTPIRAASTCSVGVRNWVTPSTEEWLGLAPPSNLGKQTNPGTGNARLDRISNPASPGIDDTGRDEATRWCSDVASQGLQELQNSSFYSVIQPFNRSACTFGTGLIFMEEGKQNLFRFQQFKVGTYCIAENDEKIVDTVFRWFKLTVRQAAQKFGEENLNAKMRKAYAAQKFDEEHTFIHCCFPNEDYKKEAIGAEGMAFASVYITEQDKKVVEKDGYEEMPYFCVRWSRWGSENEVWGCSPAFETLAEARQLNAIEQFDDSLVELQAFPPQIVPDSLDGAVEQASGGTTVVKAEDMARGVVPKLWSNTGPSAHQAIDEKQQKKAKAINDAFFVNVFNALGQLEDKDMTATEVSQRIGEKLDQFTGTFDQYRTELINPLVLRMIGIMYRAGRLADPPQSLMVKADKDPKSQPELAVPKIQIKSRVTLALNEVRNVGTAKTMEMLQPLIEARPEVLDNFNLDNLVRNTGRNYGMAESNFRPLKEVSALRDQRAKMQQQQNALHSAEIAATAAGKLGKAPEQLQYQVTQQIGGAAGGQAAA